MFHVLTVVKKRLVSFSLSLLGSLVDRRHEGEANALMHQRTEQPYSLIIYQMTTNRFSEEEKEKIRVERRNNPS